MLQKNNQRERTDSQSRSVVGVGYAAAVQPGLQSNGSMANETIVHVCRKLLSGSANVKWPIEEGIRKTEN